MKRCLENYVAYFIPVKFYSLHESLRVLFVSDDANMDYDEFGATYKLLNHSPPSK